MFKRTQLLQLAKEGLFPSSDDFDYAVRRLNQDLGKLVVLARRNKTRINHICLLQSREKSRVLNVNKGRNKKDHVSPKILCKASYMAV